VGRIRKTLAWMTSPGGNMHGIVRAESYQEESARRTVEAITEQNRLVEDIARRNGTLPQQQAMACCEACRELGCDETMPAVSIAWVKTGLICDCVIHHRTAPGL
jgi:hypothetical protein